MGVLLGVLGSPLLVPPLPLLLGCCRCHILLSLVNGCGMLLLLLLLSHCHILLVGGVPLPYPPLLLVHLLHGLLLLEVGHVDLSTSLRPPHFLNVILLVMWVHSCSRGRRVVLLGGVAGR